MSIAASIQARISALACSQRICALSVIPCLLLGIALIRHPATISATYSQSEVNEQMDQRLTRAAASALQNQEGTIIVIDPQTGRVITVVNSTMAFENAFAPGSTLKPFAALAAMRSGLIKSTARTQCHAKYTHKDFQMACSHPQPLPPLNPSEALAYSCNYYFGKLGERINERKFEELLSSFGFGKRTGINAERESEGKLATNGWEPEDVLGNSDYVQVTPIQLLLAYSALLNGGNLFTPRTAPAKNFNVELKNTIPLASDERKIIQDGLRGTIRFGTAEHSGLSSLPLYILGKTGTSTPLRGFRTQGWFVGFASGSSEQPMNPELGVLVFLKRSHGETAAEASRKIFEEYASIRSSNPSGNNVEGRLSSATDSSPTVRVHLVGENVTRAMSVEDYVLGVVAAEGSMETRLEALKALAVASRSYALKNIGRHRDRDFDFCTTTHCQRFSSAQPRDLIRRAVTETRGEVLRDKNGAIADAYFSASCGGETADVAKLWGAQPQPYLRGVKDEFCDVMPHSHWTDSISAKDLLRAVNSDPRTEIGDELKDVSILREDETGRAERIAIVGKGRRSVSGWDFKIIVGRALGWNLLKSSRFKISRSGSSFVFRGSGFGHGLGLCQEGAHVMAERGFEYHQILFRYFPGTGIATKRRVPSADLLWPAGLRSQPGSDTFSLRQGPMFFDFRRSRRLALSHHFRISYPGGASQSDAEYLLQLLERMRSDLLRRPALPADARLPFIEIFLNETTGDFVGRSGLPWWAAAASSAERIELQPIALLRKRGILETTLRHELVHMIVDSISNGKAPRWLAEGLALNLAGEGPMISRFQPRQRITISELERRLASFENPQEMRQLYAAAYAEVHSLIRSEGEAAVWQRLARAGK